MAEDTQATEVAPVEEKKSGIGFSGVLGAAGGGALTYVGIDGAVTKPGIRKVISPEAPKEGVAPKDPQFGKGVKKVLDNTKNASLKEGVDTLKAVKAIKPEEFTKIEVVAADKLHNVTFHTATGSHTFTGVTTKLEPGIHDTADKVKAFVEGDKAPLKTVLADTEKAFTKGIKKAGGFGFGTVHANWGGKLAIVGGTIAGAVVGAKVLHAIFGGKHSKKVEEQQSQAEAGQVRA